MRLPWKKKRETTEEEWQALSTTATRTAASTAKARASRSVLNAHSTASLVDNVTERLESLRTQNHFGEMLQEAMGEKKK